MERHYLPPIRVAPGEVADRDQIVGCKVPEVQSASKNFNSDADS